MSATLEQARRVFWQGMREALKLSPRAQAEAAYCLGGPSVDELERLVRSGRAKAGMRNSAVFAA